MQHPPLPLWFVFTKFGAEVVAAAGPDEALAEWNRQNRLALARGVTSRDAGMARHDLGVPDNVSDEELVKLYPWYKPEYPLRIVPFTAVDATNMKNYFNYLHSVLMSLSQKRHGKKTQAEVEGVLAVIAKDTLDLPWIEQLTPRAKRPSKRKKKQA